MRPNFVCAASIAASLALPLASRPAAADCQSQYDDMRPVVAQLPDSRRKTFIGYDFHRIDHELAESDEVECLQALAHATHLLSEAQALAKAQAQARQQESAPPPKQPPSRQP